jgi:hypothetical protein
MLGSAAESAVNGNADADVDIYRYGAGAGACEGGH